LRALIEAVLAQPFFCSLWRKVLTRNHRYIRKLVQNHLFAGDTPQRVLELGCGVGFLAQWLPGRTYIGIDTSWPYIRYARAHHGPLYSHMDACRLGIKDGAFSHVLAFAFFHHLSDGQLLGLSQEVKRVLRPEGLFLWMDGIKPASPARMTLLLQKWDQGEHFRTAPEYRNLFRPHFSSVAEFNDRVSFWPLFGMLMRKNAETKD
jgi:SAM-dependent methyltransferase